MDEFGSFLLKRANSQESIVQIASIDPIVTLRGVAISNTAPAPRNSEFLTSVFMIFESFLERFQTSKTTTLWRLQNTTSKH